MTCIVLDFSREDTANYLVAGIPAAARAAHQVALAANEERHIGCCVIAVPGGWLPSQWCLAELARLAPQLDIRFADGNALDTDTGILRVRGEALLPAQALVHLLFQSPQLRINTMAAAVVHRSSHRGEIRELRRKGDAIIAATGKSGDGIVSRHINRPVSRLISRKLLRLPGVKPVHATLAAAALGIAMAVCLFAGGEEGLVIGALLFQLASIVDGVDGEIARATFRSSSTGAMLDSITDAATNLTFFAGLAFNLGVRGHHWPAIAGVTGLVLLSIGLLLIGRRARVANRPFTFDAVKDHFGTKPSKLKQWLTWLTMRDFYAAAAAICVIAGFASQMLVLFAAAAAAWLTVSITVLIRTGRLSSTA